MMAKLITEYSQDFQITEDKNKDMYVVGIFSSAEIENNNKRKYKKEILEREIQKVNEKVDKKCLWGELGHPPNPEVNPDKIALRTVNLEWKGTNLYGKAKLLDTPMGQIAKTLVKEGAMGISSRGLGTVGDDGYVNEDFHLITWDLVTDPSNKPSWVNGIYEGQDFSIPGTDLKKEPTEDDIRKAQKVHYRQLLEFIDSMSVNESYSVPFTEDPNFWKLVKKHWPKEAKQLEKGYDEKLYNQLRDYVAGSVSRYGFNLKW